MRPKVELVSQYKWDTSLIQDWKEYEPGDSSVFPQLLSDIPALQIFLHAAANAYEEIT